MHCSADAQTRTRAELYRLNKVAADAVVQLEDMVLALKDNGQSVSAAKIQNSVHHVFTTQACTSWCARYTYYTYKHATSVHTFPVFVPYLRFATVFNFDPAAMLHLQETCRRYSIQWL